MRSVEQRHKAACRGDRYCIGGFADFVSHGAASCRCATPPPCRDGGATRDENVIKRQAGDQEGQKRGKNEGTAS
jgi:hypothetical protein